MEKSNFDKSVIDLTKQWINNFVVKLNLCPFAQKAIGKDSILYSICYETEVIPILESLQSLFLKLQESETYSTGFIIFPTTLQSFENYLSILDISQEFLETSGWYEKYQLASFHPKYLFEGEDPEHHSHFTNRSPYPMLHILDVDEVSFAIEQYPDTEQIPIRNKAKLNQMTLLEIEKIIGEENQ